MQFELTDEVINQLVFSMEDQNEKNIFDSVQKIVVETKADEQTDTDRYYSLPIWNSVNGFKIMEHFVSVLHSPLAREELRTAIFVGRGAFRNFKNVLKEYPEVEHIWFSFKQKEIKKGIIQWYNVLRDSWGLERIGAEPDETEELVRGDFVFRKYNEKRDALTILEVEEHILKEIESTYGGELGVAAASLWQLQKKSTMQGKELTFVAETAEGDFSGFIRASPFPSTAKKTVLITALFVLPAWRGLGMGKEFFYSFLQELHRNGVRWILIADMLIPQTFTRVLLRNGFTKTDIGFIVDLLADSDQREY